MYAYFLLITFAWNQARGLDVLPTTISRFRSGGDDKTADLLENVVYPEEITHCAAGVRWFKFLCLRSRNLPVREIEVGEGKWETRKMPMLFRSFTR